MNKAYRLVWSERQGRFIAVPEFARSQGKGGERLLLAALLLAPLFISPVWAQNVVASGGTNTTVNAVNGVPVVDIAAASAAGLSHNKYNKFNVDSNGLVLNNNAAAGAVVTDLAGVVARNAKLSAAARLILNEVVIQERSALKGYMEVAGTRASVVVANPWGITCNGCGFINTDRATLSTGVPQIVNGDLDKLHVSGGDIRIEGAGLQGQSTNILDLVARSLVVDGQIKANDLQLIAGSNDYNYAQRSATAIAASTTSPSYAIDSTALGGMYAQKIALIATEQGVGVRMLGDAAASASDFTLTAAGAIELRAKSINAERDMAVTSSAGNLALAGAALFAKGALGLNASAGEISVDATSSAEAYGSIDVAGGSAIRNQGKLKGAGQVSVQASNAEVQLDNSGLIQATGKLVLGSSGHLVNLSNSSKLLAGDTLSIEGGRLVNSDTVQAAKGTVIHAVTLSNTGSGAKWLLSTEAGKPSGISLSAGLDNQGLVQAAGTLSVTTGGELLNSGSISVPASPGVTSTLSLIGDTLTNNGTIVGSGPTTLSATKTTGTSLTNSGQINSGGALTLSTGGGIIANLVGGEVISDQGLSISSSGYNGSLTNAGRLQSGGAMSLVAVSNAGVGVILSQGALQIKGSFLFNGGSIEARNGASVDVRDLRNGSADNSSAKIIFASPAGVASNISLSGDLDNYGQLVASGKLAVTGIGKMVNRPGALIWATDPASSSGSLNLNSSTIQNWGVIYGAGSTSISTSSPDLEELTNYSGATLHSTGDLSIVARGRVSNDGSIEGGAALSISAGGATNTATITSVGTMTVGNSGTDVFSVENRSPSSVIDAGGKFIFLGGGTPLAYGRTSGLGALDNQGKIAAAQGFQLDVSSLTNGSATNSSAKILAMQGSTNNANKSSISATSMISNYGAIYSADGLSISANLLQNHGTGGITSRQGLNITALNQIENNGALYSGNQGLSLRSYKINNYTGGTIQSVTALTSVSDEFNNFGAIRAGDVSIETRNLFFNGLETAVTGVINYNSASSETPTLIDTWREGGCLRCDERLLYQDAVTYRQQLSEPLPAIKPQILASGTLSLDYKDGAATNYAGVLSGNTVNIKGSGTFTNKDLTLDEITYYRRAIVDKTDGIGWRNAVYAYLAATETSPYTKAAASRAERQAVRKLKSWGNIQSALEHSFLFEKTRVTYLSAGAGVYANTLNVSAGQLKNLGSPYTFTDSRLAQGGFSIVLPTNPNGYFVLNPDAKSPTVIVTNPYLRDQVGGMNSAALEKLLGYSPDDELIRLGDDNYEDYLISQQLISQNASPLLLGNQAALINRLRTQAVAEAGSLKLEYGKELTAAQIKGLSKDIVWMVKTNVGNKVVLAPRVYLSESTQAMIKSGAVLAAQNTTINAGSLNNTGGAIVGARNLSIGTTGSLTNTSGKLVGGSVKLDTKGDIINSTFTQGNGNTTTFRTNIGKTAQIEATTGTLVMQSGRQIKVQGAQVKAAKSATLTAVGPVTLEGIVDKTTTSSGELIKGGNKNSTTTTQKKIGSTLTAGDNVRIASDADTLIKASHVRAGGALDILAKGDVGIVADQNTTTTREVSKAAGWGVGGSVYGTEKKTSETFKGSNVGSTVQAGGNAKIDSGGAQTVQGSEVKVGGNADLTAKKGVGILDGKNESRSDSKTETTAFLKFGDGKGTQASVNKAPVATAKAADGMAQAKAGVGVEAVSRHDFSLFEKTTTSEKKSETQSVGSKLAVGGNLRIGTDQPVTVQGSDVSAGKKMTIDAAKIDVLAGTSTREVSTEKSRLALGLFEESGARASAQSSADAHGAVNPGGTLAGGAAASASAKTSAETAVTIGLKKESETKKESSTTRRVSTLTSGDDMKIVAKGDNTFAGAKVVSQGDLETKGANVINRAVKDISETTITSTSHLAGINYGGAASAGASANAGLQAGIGASAEVGAKVEAKAEATAGVRYKNEQKKSTERKETQVTNSFTAGKNIQRTASDTILDQGTQLQAGGSFRQSAGTITDQAVSNSTIRSSDDQTHDARFGGRAGASAEAGFSGNATLIGKSDAAPKAEASAGLGLKGSYQGQVSAKTENSKKAVTSSYTAGKDISSMSKRTTSLEGAKLVAGGDVKFQVGKFEATAAKDTSESSSRTHDTNFQLTGTLVGTPGVDTDVTHKTHTEKTTSSVARGALIQSGGRTDILSSGDNTLIGTKIVSQGKTTIDAKGDVKFGATQNTSSSSAQDINANAGIKAGAGSVSGNLGAYYGKSDQSKKTGLGTQIDSQGGVVIKADKDITLEGALLKSKGDIDVLAKKKVKLLETTTHETETTFQGGVGFKGKRPTPGAGDKTTPTTPGAGDKTAPSAPGAGASPGNKPTPTAPGASSGELPKPVSTGTGPADQPSRPGASAGEQPSNRGVSPGERAKSGDDVGSARQPTSTSPPGKPGGKPKPNNGGGDGPDKTPIAAADKLTGTAPTTGVNGSLYKSDKITSTATSIKAGGKVNIKGDNVDDQNAELVSGQGKTRVDGTRTTLKKTSKNEVVDREFTFGSPTKKKE